MKNIFSKLLFTVSALGLSVQEAFAQSGAIVGGADTIYLVNGGNNGATGLLNRIANFAQAAIPVIFTVGLAFFLGSLVWYFLASNSDDKKKARSYMLNGVITLFVMSAVFGLVIFISQSTGVGTGGNFSGQTIIPSININ